MCDAVKSMAIKFVQKPTANIRIANPDPISPIPTIVGAW